MAHLVIRDAPEASKRGALVPLGDAPVRLGRGSDCGIAIADDALSRRHAEFFRQGDAFCVRDLGSINGTSVNGERLAGVRPLRHGDLIVAGFTRIVFEEPEAMARLATIAAPVPRGPGAGRVESQPGVVPAATAPPPAPSLPAPSAPAEVPRTAPVAGSPRKPAGTRRGLVACCGCFVLALGLVAAGGAIWWMSRGRLPLLSGAPPATGDREAAEPAIEATDYGIAPAKPIEVSRGAELAAAEITAARGGSLSTPDGLSIEVPAGTFETDRSVRVYAATVPAPQETVALVGEGEAQLVALKAWDVDAGPDEGLFAGAAEIRVRCEKGQIPLYAAISVDGRRWTKVPATIDGETVTFKTRHFSPVTILGLSQAAAVVLPIVAVTYVVIERAEELPSIYQPAAPFVSIDVNPRGFEIYWSRKLAGVDPKSGFRDEAGYKRELEKVAREYKALGGGGTTGAASRNAEIAELKRKYLMPEAVREIEAALVYAQGYLKTRKIDEPMLSIPVYVVPRLGDASGQVNNPWTGRRYMLVSAESPRDVVWTTALHELFHHYQAGYVWLDRTSHLPFVEASALLMEREAQGDYAAAGKPFAITEGVALAQMLVYRNGFDGPKEWKEAYVRRHGYGLTWFLEFLRDDRYVGILKKNDPKSFHAELLKQWRSRWTGAMEKGFRWAAGSDALLATAWIEFARDQVLKGPVDGCGSRTPYGAKYSGCPLSDSPYAGHADDYGLPATKVDLRTSAFRPLGDDDIARWSIQFYEITPPARPKAAVVLKVPREWFPAKGKARGVFVRASAADEVAAMAGVDQAPPSGPDAYAVMQSTGAPVYAYVVDTGQTGSGWVYSNKPAAIFVLEPPGDVKSELSGNTQKLSWTTPAAASQAGLVSGYRIYEAGGAAPLAFVKTSATSFELEVTGGAKAVEMTSAIEAGTASDGSKVYIESPRSEPVGAANAGRYELCLDITGDIVAQGHACDGMIHNWSFDSVNTCVDVDVGPGGQFTFSKTWDGRIDPSSPSRSIALEGEGTFVGSLVKVKGTYTASKTWGNYVSHYQQKDNGSFSGEGKFIGDTFFGNQVSGTYSSTITWWWCTAGTQDTCTEEKSKSSSCSGATPPLLSSIYKFERK